MLPALPKPLRLDLTRSFSLLWSSSNFSPSAPHRPIVVLDSSYNPPSRAHAALCLASLSAKADPSAQLLLLLATKNADAKKTNKDESVLQRKIEMVHAMAQDLVDVQQDLDIAIALVGEPYFTQKNAIINELWPQSTLSWIIGTLTRFFDPKYYPEGVEAAVAPFFQAGSRILWFSRPLQASSPAAGTEESATSSQEEAAFLCQPQVNMFADGLQQIPVPPEALQISSTRARQAVQRGDQKELDLCVSPRVQAIVKREGLYQEE